jgi:acyl dehydratase
MGASAESLDWSAPFSALREGLTFTTQARAVTEADVVAFAELTGDHHPQHVDAAWAAGSSFGEQIAHGLLVLSAAAGLVPFDPERVVALRRSEAVFKRPVHLGDEIRIEGSVIRLRELGDDGGIVTCRWNVLGREDKTVVRAEIDVVWR